MSRKLSPVPFRYPNDGLNLIISDNTAVDFMVVDPATGELVKELTRTQQQFAADCDVNTMVERFVQTGHMNGNTSQPLYGDFIDAPDFQRSMDIVIEGQNAFAALDAKTRKYFSNDPLEYLQFVNDPANLDEAVRLGIMSKMEVDAPVDRKGISEGVSNPPPSSSPAKASKSPSSGNES